MVATVKYDFDTVYNRRGTNSSKWSRVKTPSNEHPKLEDDMLSMWVADMDFAAPQVIIDAMQERLRHPFFGYNSAPDELREAIVAHMKTRYDWDIQPDWLLFNAGTITNMNVVTQALGKEGTGVLMNSPIYGPFLSAAPHRKHFPQLVEMQRIVDDPHTFHYEIDFESFESAATENTSLYYLCDPHNPSGKAFTREELEKLADICLRHNVIIASDAIHCGLLLGDTQHVPIASISPEIANQTVTMVSNSKSFSMSGQLCSVAIVPNKAMREKLSTFSKRSGYHVDIMSYTGATAAYRDGGEWLEALCNYLTVNRDYALNFIREYMPMLKTTIPDATYLLWIDCRDLNLPEEYDVAQPFFLGSRTSGVQSRNIFRLKQVKVLYA